MWLGSVTFDRDVGLSRYTGQVTHHIAPDVDAERDGLTNDLKSAKVVEAIYAVTGVGPTLFGRNGEGWKIRRSSTLKTGHGRQSREC